MAYDPILILQMQRMGDLVLSFPLLAWLAAKYPSHPIWVVGERIFFEPLIPLSPQVTYFNYEKNVGFGGQKFFLVINLSHRKEAAHIAASVRCEQILGAFFTQDGGLHINGNWQLYRASLTNNNRYNRYHWADLHALDCISPEYMCKTRWPAAQIRQGHGKVGLFVGASEPDKHPEANFWASLAKHLFHMGYKPVLLGGVAEQSLGREVATLLGAYALNLCGHFQIRELVDFISRLDLLIVPDTGPMHVAAWTGTPTLNLSLGPVNPWETGPFSPGHHVVQTKMPCAGCWHCEQPEVLCKQTMFAGHVAKIAETILQKGCFSSITNAAKEVQVFATNRSKEGLYQLDSVAGKPAFCTHRKQYTKRNEAETLHERDFVAQFWQSWFGEQFQLFLPGTSKNQWTQLQKSAPKSAEHIQRGIVEIIAGINRAKRQKQDMAGYFDTHWEDAPQELRPFTGYAQMRLQNDSGNQKAQLELTKWFEALFAISL